MIYFNRLFMLAFQQSDLLLPTFKFELFQLNCQNLHRKDKKILNLKLESFRFSLYFKKSNKLNYPLIFSFLFIYSFRFGRHMEFILLIRSLSDRLRDVFVVRLTPGKMLEYIKDCTCSDCCSAVEKWRGFLYSGVLVFFFFFVFHAKSGTTNSHLKGSSDIPNWSPQKIYDIKKIQKVIWVLRKIVFLVFIAISSK